MTADACKHVCIRVSLTGAATPLTGATTPPTYKQDQHCSCLERGAMFQIIVATVVAVVIVVIHNLCYCVVVVVTGHAILSQT